MATEIRMVHATSDEGDDHEVQLVIRADGGISQSFNESGNWREEIPLLAAAESILEQLKVDAGEFGRILKTSAVPHGKGDSTEEIVVEFADDTYAEMWLKVLEELKETGEDSEIDIAEMYDKFRTDYNFEGSEKFAKAQAQLQDFSGQMESSQVFQVASKTTNVTDSILKLAALTVGLPKTALEIVEAQPTLAEKLLCAAKLSADGLSESAKKKATSR